jgi:hypothetical protein
MTDQNTKNKPQDSEKETSKQTEQNQEDVLALDTDDEMEDLVESIEDTERALKEEKE